MTTKTPPPGNNLGMTTLPRDSSRDEIQARVVQWCNWFGLTVPRIKKSGISLSADSLIAWCNEEAAPLDWIILGDMKPIAWVYRTLRLMDRKKRAESPTAEEADQLEDGQGEVTASPHVSVKA